MRVSPPPALRASIMRDLRPVRPLAAPWARALVVVPCAAAALWFVPWRFGVREDSAALGPWLSWGVSLAEAALGVLLAGMAMREAVPGRAFATRTVLLTLVGAFGLVLAVTLLTYAVSPTFAQARYVVLFFRLCFRDAFLAGLPVVVVASGLVARAWPMRPAAAGALYGAGGGLIGDASWRIFCEVSDPRHVLLAHGLAVVALTLVGCVAACGTEWVRARRR